MYKILVTDIYSHTILVAMWQTWGNSILYSFSNSIQIYFLSIREVFCIRGSFRIKVFVFEYIAKVMYSWIVLRIHYEYFFYFKEKLLKKHLNVLIDVTEVLEC